MTSVSLHPTLSTLAEKYDYWIIDLWGVVHDGEQLYPGVPEALEQLRAMGKKIIFLSNAPRRARKAEAVLENLGITRSLYDHVLTSGEVTYQYLQESGSADSTSAPALSTPHCGGQESGAGGNYNYIYIGPQKDADILDGLDYHMTDDASKASFALVTGFDSYDSTFEEKWPQAEACLKAGLPLICANPDDEVVKQDGRRMLCAGLIAKEYERRDGKVIWFGKPYPAVYEQCIELFGLAEEKESAVSKPREPSACSMGKLVNFPGNNYNNFIAIGDNLHTDIAGANGMGIYSVLCSGGILAGALGVTPGELPSAEAVQALCEKEGVFPHAVIPAFVWE